MKLNEGIVVIKAGYFNVAVGASLPIGKVVIGALLAIFCIAVGLLVALVPAGFLIRLLVVPVALGFLGVCWLLRRQGVGLPGRFSLAVWLAAVFLSVVWPRYIFFSVGGPNVNPATLAILASLALVAFWFVYSPEFTEKFNGLLLGPVYVGVLALVWLAWRFLASVLGDYPLASVIEYMRDLAYISSFLFIGCAVATYQNGSSYLLRVILLAGFLVASVGLVEAFVQKNYFVQFASGRDSQAVADALKTIAFDKTRDGSYRAQSVFDHPIVFAQFIAAVVPLGIYFAICGRGWLWRLLGLLVVPIGFLAILKSGSRAGLVSLAVCLSCVMGFFWLRGIFSAGFKKAFAVMAVPILAVGLVLAYFVVQQLVLGRSAIEASSTSVRLKMVADGVAALFDSPIWGFGHGMALTKAGVVSGHTGVATIDSFLLTIALDAGYVGLTLFVLIVAVFVFRGVLAAVTLPRKEATEVGMIVASILALVATFAGLSIGNNMTLFWLLIAAALPVVNNLPKSNVKRRR